jgi:tRNA-binding protein
MAETVQQYTERILSFARGLDPMAVLASTPARIGALIAGRSIEDLQRTPEPARWSVAQIVTHLADAEVVHAYRIRMILSAPGVDIQAYDQNAWSASQHTEHSDAYASLSLFTAVRGSMVRLLRGLTDEERDRYGVHAERGRESIRHITTLYAGHDRNHLAQIERLIAEQPPASSTFAPVPVEPPIDYESLERIDVRVGTIRAAVPVSGADRVAVLTVDFGDHTRSIVAGIQAERPNLEAVVGVQTLFVVNLAPKTIRGQLSEGMLFDAGFADDLRPAFLQPEWPMPDGVRVG